MKFGLIHSQIIKKQVFGVKWEINMRQIWISTLKCSKTENLKERLLKDLKIKDRKKNLRWIKKRKNKINKVNQMKICERENQNNYCLFYGFLCVLLNYFKLFKYFHLVFIYISPLSSTSLLVRYVILSCFWLLNSCPLKYYSNIR